MPYVIKVELREPRAPWLVLTAVKTMYSGKRIAPGDIVYLFASETSGGAGLVARGRVTSAEPVPRRPGPGRQAPRVSLTIERTALAKRRLGRAELRPFSSWNDGRPETELNFKFYRQATDKIGGISESTATFLEEYFRA